MRRRAPAAVAAALIVSFSTGIAGSVPAVAAGSRSGVHGSRAVVSGSHPTISRSGSAGPRPAGGGAGAVTALRGPAVSPPQAAILPGIVIPLDGAPEGVAVDAAGTVAVSVRNPAAVVLFPINEPMARHTVPLSGAARHLSLAGPSGPLLVPEATGNTLIEVGLPVGTNEEAIPIGRGPQEAVALGADTLVVVDQPGGTVRLVRDGRVVRTVSAPGRPGDVAASPDGTGFVVLASRNGTLTEYTATGDVVGHTRAGVGPTHVVAGGGGLYWVVDTAAGSVLGFRPGPHGPVRVATLPVGQSGSRPYGLAFDSARDTLWVTLTGTNQLLGLHLRGDQVVGRTTYTTVRQPNTVAVQPSSGAVVVTGSTPQGQVQFFGVQAS